MATAVTATIPARARGGRERLFVVLGAAMALLAFLVAGGLAAMSAIKPTAAASRVIVVAARDIPIRTVIGAGDLTTVAVSEPLAGTYTKAADLNGLVTMVAVAKGHPLVTSMMASSPDLITESAAAYLPLAKGYVAMTIPTSEQQGVAGYIHAGDYISLIATLNTGILSPNNQRVVSKTVFTNLHVIRVGPNPADTSQAPAQQGSTSRQQAGLSSSLTVVMTECDAEYLNWLLANSTMKYVLESYKDYATAPTGPDPSCPAITAAGGVGPGDVEARWHFTARG
jgi:Flp pilus assembly protein CpaB